jgi:hypothetical protein
MKRIKLSNKAKNLAKITKKTGLVVKRSPCRMTWGVFFGKTPLEVVHTQRAAEATLVRLNKKFPMLGAI